MVRADKMKIIIIFFFRETPTSTLDQYRMKFWPLWRVFLPNRPQTEPLLGKLNYKKKAQVINIFQQDLIWLTNFRFNLHVHNVEIFS